MLPKLNLGEGGRGRMREFAGWRVWELGGATLSYWDIKFVEYVWQSGRETGRDQIMRALYARPVTTYFVPGTVGIYIISNL